MENREFSPNFGRAVCLRMLITFISLALANTGIGYLVTRVGLNNETKEIGKEKAEIITNGYAKQNSLGRAMFYGNYKELKTT